jgi:hypothetical protein
MPDGEDDRFRIGKDELPGIARFGTPANDFGECHAYRVGRIRRERDASQGTTGKFDMDGHGDDKVMACPGNELSAFPRPGTQRTCPAHCV